MIRKGIGAKAWVMGVQLISALAFLATPANADVSASIVNGIQEIAQPTTAAVIRGGTTSGYVECSAVLVGCDSLLTAAHCFGINPGEITDVFFQHAGLHQIESVTLEPKYLEASLVPPWFRTVAQQDAMRMDDIAFIKLTNPISGITPSPLVVSGAPTPGTAAELVGFGRDPVSRVTQATADDNVGIKRSGTIQLSACSGSLTGYDILCWNSGSGGTGGAGGSGGSGGSAGVDVTHCNGDSGGPLFANGVVAGLTKGAVLIGDNQPDLCMAPSLPWDTSVYRHLPWIHGGTGSGGVVATSSAISLNTSTCSALPQLDQDVQSGDQFGNCDSSAWGGETSRTCGFTDFLPLSATSTYSFDVPPGTGLLRVALNGIAQPTNSVKTNF
jgi:hypothetical protein